MEQSIAAIYKNPTVFYNQELRLTGWVRNHRAGKQVGFIELVDGSYPEALQLVYSADQGQGLALEELSLGAAVAVSGRLVATPEAKQAFELRLTALDLVGGTDEDYPLQKKRHSFEYLRTIAHLRPRANTFQSVFRLRSLMSFAVHRYFHEKGFLQVHTPILTASDAEGAGEMFQVTALDLAHLAGRPPAALDYKDDFFGRPAHLAVSGQLNAEAFAHAFKNVYSFGPTFRAENSNTARHAAEFWMIEPECAFCDLDGLIDLAEDFIRAMIQTALDEAPQDIQFFNDFIDDGLIRRLEAVQAAGFSRMTYTEAIALLEKSGHSFAYPVSWGLDLQTEHERFLTDEVVKGPVFVTDYPEDIKAFYMRGNDDQKTVAAVDLLVPGIGEIIGGSQREERFDLLAQRLAAKGMSTEAYQWYLDLRRYGGTPHAGFGVGFERLLMYLSGMKNIRDVIPFPRVPKQIDF
ncbi:asparagine--tRNA ligase [Peptococcus simiae]|uniref:asparagine--tRNA ligase n=1 Tax=Peptococcus simiae TaxID=1643805 RepID=UPI00398018B1